MENKVTANFAVVLTRSLDIDFEEVYNFVKNHVKETRGLELSDEEMLYEFGDNMEYYIDKIYSYKVEVNDHNDDAMEVIFDKWDNWLNKKRHAI